MKKLMQLLQYSLAQWLVVFAVAMALGPLRSTERPLFESSIAVVLALSSVWVAIHYLRQQRGNFGLEGLRLGLAGLAVNLALDLVMFSYGPMQMPLLDYLKDIGLTYLMIPVITIGFGYLLDKQMASPSEEVEHDQATSKGTRATL